MVHLQMWFMLLVSLMLLTGCSTLKHIDQEPEHPWKTHTIDNSSLGADGARSMDVNNDGLPDIVAGWEQGGVSRIYLMQREKPGIPTWKQIEVGLATSVEDALLVDLDKDGAVDVVSSTEGKHKKMLVHWAPTISEHYTDSSMWNTETLFEDGSQWMFSISMDVDGKNGPDLIIGGKGQDGKLGWLESPKDPRNMSKWMFHPLMPTGWVMSLLSKDMDNDGDFDILLSDRKGTQSGIFWLENPGKTSEVLTSPWKTHTIADHMKEPMLIDTFDMDDDGIEEIVVPYYVDDVGFMSIFHTKDRKTWSEKPVTYPENMGRAKSLQVGDINLDGNPDLILSTEHADDGKSGIVWLEYQDSWDKPDWIAHDVSGPEGIKFDLNLLLDVDGDGDMDIVNTEENNNARGGNAGLGLIWYENPQIN